MKTLTISNQKGGVAKTTTAISLAGAMAARGARVLACDLDPQANLSMGLGVEPGEPANDTLHVLLGTSSIEAAVVKTRFGIDLLAADLTLAAAERKLMFEIGFDEILRDRLREVRDRYDVVIVDSPPSLGLLTINAITAADVVIVPVQCEYFSARGLGQLLEVTDLVRRKRRPGLVVRVLPTLLDRRNRVCKDVLEGLRDEFGDEMFDTAIGVDTRIREAAAVGEPITSYSASSRGAKQYVALAAELVARGLAPRTEAPSSSVTRKRRARRRKPSAKSAGVKSRAAKSSGGRPKARAPRQRAGR